MTYDIPSLPLQTEVESIAMLKKLPGVRAALAELKGIAATIPNIAISRGYCICSTGWKPSLGKV